jgi:transcriptional regulator with XRE-family HTH domain
LERRERYDILRDAHPVVGEAQVNLSVARRDQRVTAIPARLARLAAAAIIALLVAFRPTAGVAAAEIMPADAAVTGSTLSSSSEVVLPEAPSASAAPTGSTMPAPTATPDPGATPDPIATPDPSTTPAPAVGEPTASPASPSPSLAADPSPVFAPSPSLLPSLEPEPSSSAAETTESTAPAADPTASPSFSGIVLPSIEPTASPSPAVVEPPLPEPALIPEPAPSAAESSETIPAPEPASAPVPPASSAASGAASGKSSGNLAGTEAVGHMAAGASWAPAPSPVPPAAAPAPAPSVAEPEMQPSPEPIVESQAPVARRPLSLIAESPPVLDLPKELAIMAVPAVAPAVAHSAVQVAVDFGKSGSGWAATVVFNLWLRRQLRERRMSQRQLAMLSGVDHSTISRLLRGDRAPTLETATKLAHALRQVAQPDEAPIYFDRLAQTTIFPTQRVEAALLGDEELEDVDDRSLMHAYLALRARRRREKRLGNGGAVLELGRGGP